ncbi:hypothetical protein DPMN_071387 [Dreissena polymorpha]|uniref:Uncharacterized protein n=1 Tax=Dreissena polymorpha TaxID=45954 RepID=A0A9D3Z6V2_DREPO|nr:hypothetical protein DPMN_071387 [Dreissena polymorpha]
MIQNCDNNAIRWVKRKGEEQISIQLKKTSFRDVGVENAKPFVILHSIRQGNLSPGTPKGKEGGLETPGAVTWMQMLSRWATRERLAHNRDAWRKLFGGLCPTGDHRRRLGDGILWV